MSEVSERSVVPQVDFSSALLSIPGGETNSSSVGLLANRIRVQPGLSAILLTGTQIWVPARAGSIAIPKSDSYQMPVSILWLLWPTGALLSSRELPGARALAHLHCRMPDGPSSSLVRVSAHE